MVWCVGSSIIKQAFIAARKRHGGVNLGLRVADLWWQGYSGLSLKKTIDKIQTLEKVGEQPDFILLHCGGNDIGRISLKGIRATI